MLLKIKYLFLGTFFLVSLSWLGILDSVCETFIEGSLTDALIAFGVAELVNGIVSSFQTTTIMVPMVGNVSIGEALDPVNDAVEQFSYVMKFSIASLLIQRIFIEISASLWFKVILTLSWVVFIYAILRGNRGVAGYACKTFISVAAMRFLVLFTVIANSFFTTLFLDKPTETQLAKINDFPETLPGMLEAENSAEDILEEIIREKGLLEKESKALKKSNDDLLKERDSVEVKLERARGELNELRSQLSLKDRYNPLKADTPEMEQIKITIDELEEQNSRFDDSIALNIDKLREIESDIEIARRTIAGEDIGIMAKFSKKFSEVGSTIDRMREQFNPKNLIAKMKEFVVSMLTLTALFLLRTVVLPLVFLFALIRGIKGIWNINTFDSYLMRLKEPLRIPSDS